MTDNMKKFYLLIAACSLMTWAVTSCDPITPDPVDPGRDTTTVNPQDTTTTPTDTIVNPQDTIVNPQDTIPQDTTSTPVIPERPESVPKKHLLEEFTGQDCGYCPYGMDCVHEFIGNDTNWIVVLHHYGYHEDNFSVAGSKKITSKLSVSGAPTISINRASTKSEAGKKTCFHPGYLPTTDMSQFETTTYVSLGIENTFDAASGTLNVHLSGLVCKDEFPALKLTVLLKESGMIDYQADYYYTFEGWQEFRHANAVRAFLSDPLGDDLQVDSIYRWTADYELVLNNSWIPENCAVVAMISEAFKPVVQVEQRPVVEGTQGGADILHGGITPVPVPDYYPEPGEDISTKSYSGWDADTLNVAYSFYTPISNLQVNYWTIQAYNVNKTVKVNGTTCVPFAYLYLFTDTDEREIPTGVYKVNKSMKPGTAYAGYRDDEYMEIDGSTFYYTSKAYLQEGYLAPEAQWLIARGTLTITNNGWSLDGHALNGTPIHLFGNSKIVNQGRSSAPRRTKACTPDASGAQSVGQPPAERRSWQVGERVARAMRTFLTADHPDQPL